MWPAWRRQVGERALAWGGGGKGDFRSATWSEPHTSLGQAGRAGLTPVTHSKLCWELVAGPASQLWTEIPGCFPMFSALYCEQL